MKKDLVTAILTALIGGVIGFLLCSVFVGEIKSESIKTIDGKFSVDLSSPDPEIFNAEALNPTVEVYVGSHEETIIEEDE